MMCHFLTIQVPAPVPQEIGKDTANKYGFDYFNIRNNSVSSAFKRPCEIYATTKSFCDCGTSIGSLLEKAADYPLKKVNRMVKRKRTLGWSESRINRWVSQITGNYDKERANEEKFRTQCLHNPPDEIKRWAMFIKALLNESQAKYMGLLKHWYNGGLEEDIAIKAIKKISIDDNIENKLLYADNDIIYMFVN